MQLVFLLFFLDGDHRPRVLAHPDLRESHPGIYPEY